MLSTENITELLSWEEVIKVQAGKNAGKGQVNNKSSKIMTHVTSKAI